MKTFSFNNRDYEYFKHDYNTTWNNERAVEVPITWDYVTQRQGQRILEVGNVLSHYYEFEHDTIDKYEWAEGVVNVDIIDYEPVGKYDLVIAISTLEHVGWDEEPKDPKKILRAIEKLKDCLAPDGRIVATLPLGYNPPMDDMLDRGEIRFDKVWNFKRISAENEWRETSWKEIYGCKYNEPFAAANGMVIGLIDEAASNEGFKALLKRLAGR